MERRLWTREELILTLSVYFQLPFGRLNRTTPEVKELADVLKEEYGIEPAAAAVAVAAPAAGAAGNR